MNFKNMKSKAYNNIADFIIKHDFWSSFILSELFVIGISVFIYIILGISFNPFREILFLIILTIINFLSSLLDLISI